MKSVPLVFLPLLLMVAMVAGHGHHNRRPVYFGPKFVVYGDTKVKSCYPNGCKVRWYQTQYFQNLNKRTFLRINTNRRNVYDNNFYQRNVFNSGFNRYQLDASKGKCYRWRVSRPPILKVPQSFKFRGVTKIEGKHCEIRQRYTSRAVVETWYVSYLGQVNLKARYAPVRYVYHYRGSNISRTSVTRVTTWRGFNRDVKDSDLILPAACNQVLKKGTDRRN